MGTRNVGPAVSTGKSSVRYCPGGNLTSPPSVPRRPRNPGDTIPPIPHNYHPTPAPPHHFPALIMNLWTCSTACHSPNFMIAERVGGAHERVRRASGMQKGAPARRARLSVVS
ncbi:hypothetical protein Cch02nite_26300 [Catellatospora chokoriensis]|uniref:Uncharacterized protein n=1 Tax=Catellatospora chokoriensis TaxID=310353 RepID=A0A8J3NR54_9ACTN|nr:hypothetical protein Cch02nite_26300 [Catellatospora chokoriensis]